MFSIRYARRRFPTLPVVRYISRIGMNAQIKPMPTMMNIFASRSKPSNA